MAFVLKVEMANNKVVNKVVRDGDNRVRDNRVRDKVVLSAVVKMAKVGDKVVKEMDTNQAVVSMDKVVSMDRVVSMDKVVSLNMDKIVDVQVGKLLMVKMGDQTLEIKNMMVDWANSIGSICTTQYGSPYNSLKSTGLIIDLLTTDFSCNKFLFSWTFLYF